MRAFNKKILFALFIFYSLNLQGIYAEGLRFFGKENPIDERTSYNVFNEKSVSFSEYCEIKFDLTLYETPHIGNILRIKTNSDDHIFNLFYNGHEENYLFWLNEEGRSNLISIPIDKSDYPPGQWLTIHIGFDLKDGTITLTVGDQTSKAENIPLPEKFTPTLIFGKSDHIIDVPPFAIRDLSVGNSEKYRFRLNESQGNRVHDARGKEIGSVTNPYWLINDSYHWKSEAHFNFSTVSGTSYHKGRHELYYFNRDSIVIYNIRSKSSETIVFNTPCPLEIRLGTNFIDQDNNRLYCYEVYRSSYQEPTVVSLDLNSFEWRIESYDRLTVQLHHHASFFDSSSGMYLIFGGFGDRRFSDEFHQYDLERQEWSKYPVDNRGGITPRYFTSLGHDEENHQLYLFGGTGNLSGNQLLGREYFYDLYRLDLQTKEITKVWEIPWYKDNAVPVRGMVITNESFFYTLCYPEHFTESFLKLYRFSFKDGDYTILGDSIPIYSDKINTNANLYYDNEVSTLYAVVHEFDDDIQSELHIYSLASPPITKNELSNHPPTGKQSEGWINYLMIGVIALGGGLLLILFVRKNGRNTPVPDVGKTSYEKLVASKPAPRANTIFLFGEFTVCDRDGRDITYMLSKKLKETFCLLLQYSQEREGIASQQLSRQLWPQKLSQEVKNIRNVTLNRLRKILEELDGIELLYERGIFFLVQRDPFYCDYTGCMQILSERKWEAEYQELLDIVSRGKFLENEDLPSYDSFKEKTEKQIEPLILSAMKENYDKEAWQTVIDLAQAAFHIDPMNEAALSYMINAMQRLGMNEDAKMKYLSFLIEYKRIMGKEYPNPIKL